MARAPLEVDGSEGGGQVLRTALCLSLVTQRPFVLRRFRSHLPSPGLRPAHLAYVRAAEALGGHAEGAGLGSEQLTFSPTPVRRGDHVIEVGAGASATLVWQCLFFPLALAGGGELTLRGGTHLPHGPGYPYLRWVWMAGVTAFGFRASLMLAHAGFAPEAAGEFRGVVAPSVTPPERVTLPSRGTLLDVEVTSYAPGLPFESAERQARAAVAALRERGISSSAENMPLPVTRSSGLAVFIRAQFENTCAGFMSVGDRTASPEETGRKAAAELGRFMESSGALDEHLADQLLIPAALLASGLLGGAGPGETQYCAAHLNRQLRSTASVLRIFLPAKIELDEATGTVRVGPAV